MYVGLHGPGWLYVFGIPPWGDLPLWTSRARATDLGQGPNLRTGSWWAPCVPRSREHEERSAAGRNKNADGPKNHTHIYIYEYIRIYASLSTGWWRPGALSTTPREWPSPRVRVHILLNHRWLSWRTWTWICMKRRAEGRHTRNMSGFIVRQPYILPPLVSKLRKHTPFCVSGEQSHQTQPKEEFEYTSSKSNVRLVPPHTWTSLWDVTS